MSRDAFMREIAQMTQIIVKRAKEYDSDTIPGDYATLDDAVPELRRQGPRELSPLRVRRREDARRSRLRLLDQQDSRRPPVRDRRSRGIAAGPRDRAAAGLSQQDGPAVRRDPQDRARRRDEEPQARVRLRAERRRREQRTGRLHRPGAARRCPKCGGGGLRARPVVRLRERGQSAEDLRLQDRQDHPAAGSRRPTRSSKLLETGKTDLLPGFKSSRTNRFFKAFLVWDAEKARSASSSNRASRPRRRRRPGHGTVRRRRSMQARWPRPQRRRSPRPSRRRPPRPQARLRSARWSARRGWPRRQWPSERSRRRAGLNRSPSRAMIQNPARSDHGGRP